MSGEYDPDIFDLDWLARTIWGEARGESHEGRVAVGHVIVNRWRVSEHTIEAVCKKPGQFSCHNPGDPNEPKIRAVTYADPTLVACMNAATEALDPKRPDPTMGSKHYHAVGAKAWWAAGREPTVIIGNHVFYNSVG